MFRLQMRFLTLASMLLLADAARNDSGACGGFFCAAFPMDQVGEQILFASDGSTITMQVQIQYQGTAADFAWILPIPAVPELTIGQNEVFRQLSLTTRPAFFLQFDRADECGFFYPVLETVDGGAARSDDVEVASEERVGPYETAVIRADDAAAITEWLLANGYQIGDLGAELLEPYVANGSYFLALRLASDSDIGDLQPIGATYASEQPMVPLRLTAVATQPDLGVLVWILGSDRAVPENYLHVRINEARIDWFNGGQNYTEVVTEAANEAGGRAFVTDYAGPSEIMGKRLYAEGRFDLEKLRRVEDPARFIEELLSQGFGRDSQMQSLLRRYIPIPADVIEQGVLQVVYGGDEKAYQQAVDNGLLLALAERSFYNNIRIYEEWTGELAFDPEAFTGALEEVVVEPLRQTQELFGEFPYLTRLFTTLSADEMTVDPLFVFNPDLPGVSNTHNAKGRFECDDFDPENPNFEEIVLVVTLADGREVRSRPYAGFDSGDPVIRLDSADQPAAAIVEQMASAGAPVTLSRLTAVEDDRDNPLPDAASLLPNYPNPFNASTVIPMRLPVSDGTPATLRIYNLTGQVLRTLLVSVAGAGGYHEVTWNGRDDRGLAIGSGVYIARLESGNSSATRKLLLLQ